MTEFIDLYLHDFDTFYLVTFLTLPLCIVGLIVMIFGIKEYRNYK